MCHFDRLKLESFQSFSLSREGGVLAALNIRPSQIIQSQQENRRTGRRY